jgi:queuine tRNA-ribosyltransferase
LFRHPLSSRYSRAYLRHLLVTSEPTAGRILTLHNLAWLADLVARMRAAIVEGRFGELRRQVWETWAPNQSPPGE